MKNVLRIAAVALPLLFSANLAMAQSTPGNGLATGSEENIEQNVFGHGGFTGSAENPDAQFGRAHTSRPHRTHTR